MSLRWDITAIENNDLVCKRDIQDDGKWSLNPITEGIIFNMPVIGMGKITKENWEEVFERIHFAERIYGKTYILPNGEGEELGREGTTPAMIRNHIGLSVNVITVSKSTFLKHMYESNTRTCAQQIRQHKEAVQDVSDIREWLKENASV